MMDPSEAAMVYNTVDCVCKDWFRIRARSVAACKKEGQACSEGPKHENQCDEANLASFSR